MQTGPWWLTPLISLLAALFGALSAITAAWLTQKQDLAKQLALRKLDNDQTYFQSVLRERQLRFVTFLQNFESLYSTTQEDIKGRQALLSVVREIWLFADEDLVSKVGQLLNRIAQTPSEPSAYEVELGEIVLLMRKDLGRGAGTLTTADFRFHTSGKV